MRHQETRSFAPTDGSADLAEDVVYWASLFRANPEEAVRALKVVEAHPEPDAGHLRPAKRTGSSRHA